MLESCKTFKCCKLLALSYIIKLKDDMGFMNTNYSPV